MFALCDPNATKTKTAKTIEKGFQSQTVWNLCDKRRSFEGSQSKLEIIFILFCHQRIL